MCRNTAKKPINQSLSDKKKELDIPLTCSTHNDWFELFHQKVVGKDFIKDEQNETASQ